MIRVGVAQINMTVGDFEGNARKIADQAARARMQEIDIVVFPEMALCGYPPEDLLHKRHFVRDSQEVLRSLKKQIKGVTVVAGCLDTGTRGELYNAAAVIADGRISGIYRKECLPNYGVFDEKRYFVSGENNPVFRMHQTRIGINICEDIWLEDGPFARQCRQQCDVIINLSCSPYDIGKLETRWRLLARRAKTSGACVVYANAVGGQDEIVFDGGSCVFAPSGRRLASAALFQEDFLTVDVEEIFGKKCRVPQEIELPYHVLRERPLMKTVAHAAPAVSRIERIYRALVLGTRDYIGKNGFQGVVVGLSGGIDSALVCKIAADALGPDKVTAVTMPSCYTSSGTLRDARQLAKNLNIELREIPIGPIHEAYLAGLSGEFAGTAPGTAEENIQARIRGNLLMALSNKHGWIVLTTGNKSEMAVGYCTLYGDMSGGFAVIKDVYKTTVYELARHCNTQDGQKIIPESILERAPSAELKENQCDQDSLPSYDLLDQILIEYIEKHQSFAAIVKKVGDAQTVRKVLKLVDQSEYKRRQAPPGIKITTRAFGKDWRLPITNRYKHY